MRDEEAPNHTTVLMFLYAGIVVGILSLGMMLLAREKKVIEDEEEEDE